MRKRITPGPPVTDDALWRVTDHACRVCGGRCLERVGDDPCWMCSDCGLTVAGAVTDLCVCGERLPNGRDPHVRCVRVDTHIPGLGPVVIPEVSN
jgi:hypothetical protein